MYKFNMQLLEHTSRNLGATKRVGIFFIICVRVHATLDISIQGRGGGGGAEVKMKGYMMNCFSSEACLNE